MKCKDNTNKNLKSCAYDNLITHSKSNGYVNATKHFVMKKIQNLRGWFRKEMRTIETSKRTGCGSDDVYEPNLWYFNLLLFTKDQEMPSNSQESEMFVDSEEFIDEETNMSEENKKEQNNSQVNNILVLF